jgi:Fic family protein
MASIPQNFRSGRYVAQPTGYSAFYPEALPPRPEIVIDTEMQALLSKADRALGRLDGSIQTLPNPNLFVFMYVRKEAVLSSQIEGTQSSLNDVLEVEAEVFHPDRPRDVGEVINYIAALNYGLDRLSELPLSIRLIREIHEMLLSGVRGQHMQPGEIRTTQNWIGPRGCTLNEASFIPPPPNEVMNTLGQLEIFIHADIALPFLIKVGLIHAQFETIHPFSDGNGRIGRLLVTFLLCHNEVLIKPVLYLSHFFKQNREEYYDLLQRTRDEADWESWIKFFIRGIAVVSNEATETARDIVNLREEHRQLITEGLGRSAGNGLTVLEYIFSRPIINVNEIGDLLGVSYTSANNLVQRMVDLGLMTEITGQTRNRRFRYGHYIDLFASV